MKKANLIKKLSSISTKLNDNNTFKVESPRGEKEIDVRFQDGEVLFYSYSNYDSPIIFKTFNKVLKHFSA